MTSDIERVKEKIDIVDLVSEYIVLKKAGRNYKALSPFRTEKSPSLIVNPERQIFKDFGGDKGGDVFTFVMEMENITFAEALKHLADKAGVKLTQKTASTEEEKAREKIYTINHLTQLFYAYLLTEHNIGKNALKYLTNERKISPKLAKTFGIGFAPNATALHTYLTNKKGYTKHDLLQAGVATETRRGIIDFFRNRLIFPIFDVRGNVIAFSGRAIDNTTQPKYINTRETQIYKKSRSLYGLYQAKDDIRKAGKVIVVEGELDVISPRKEGVTNIVAAKGTALTEEHIKLLKRYAEKILFCFDSDPAGTEAQRRALQIIEKHGLSAAVIKLEGGKDPDQLINENPHAFQKAIKNEANIYDFIIDSAVTEFDKNTMEGKRKILDKTLSILTTIENEVIKEHYLKKLAGNLDTSLQAILAEAEKRTHPQRVDKKSNKKKESVEEYLLSLLLQAEDIQKAADMYATIMQDIKLSNPGREKIVKELKEGSCKKAVDLAKQLPEELLPIFDESYLRPISEFKTTIEYEKELKKTTEMAKKQIIKTRLTELAEKMNKEQDEEKIAKLGKEYTKFSEMLK